MFFETDGDKMEQESLNIVRSASKIPYSYSTIKVTQSRIDKGLLAVPVALTGKFPDHNATVEVYLNDSPASESKHYSSYNSSTRECRIGSMQEWFQQNNIRSGDEIVIHFMDEKRFIYRIIPERNFVLQTIELQKSFDRAKSEQEASEKIVTLGEWTNLQKETVVFREYLRLANSLPISERRYIAKLSNRVSENVPTHLRLLMERIYNGHCQVCDFWFLKRDKRPYFEIHHLYAEKGHHPKNLVLVCGNCHNQLEHANVKYDFDGDHLLIKVYFNEKAYSVRQALLEVCKEQYFKHLFA